jgi:hypothetical protein
MPLFHANFVILQAEIEIIENKIIKINKIKWQQLEKLEAGDHGW